MDLMVTIELDTHDHDAEAVLPALSAALSPEAGAALAVAEGRISVTLTGTSGVNPFPDSAELFGQAVTNALYRLDDALRTIQAESDDLMMLSMGRVSAEQYPD